MTRTRRSSAAGRSRPWTLWPAPPGRSTATPTPRASPKGVLDLLVQALTGQPTAYFTPWAARLHRTHAEITLLFTAGAQFARIYGPGAPASVPTSS
ncbi:hypothetical protein ACFCWB_21570 [Streptomyces bacillaris]|uniref:hypothetical protein n=1 Tax=Streptomyces bacillaris TaxID=68179 RepID=UPI0035E1E9A9